MFAAALELRRVPEPNCGGVKLNSPPMCTSVLCVGLYSGQFKSDCRPVFGSRAKETHADRMFSCALPEQGDPLSPKAAMFSYAQMIAISISSRPG